MNLVKRLVRNVWCRLLIILFLAIWVVPVATSGESTLSDEAFEDLKIKVQSTLDAVYKAAEATDEVFPGATVAFVLPNGRIAVFATGFSDIEEQIPMESDARMPAGSIGKTYVAAVALDMAQDGTLDLDKKISHWLESESWFKRLPNSDTITLRNLLNHSSGIIDHVFNMESGF
jgi:D-alanyl-D-alanine carboxypeptidase